MPPGRTGQRGGRSSRTRRPAGPWSGAARILRRGGALRTARRTSSARQALDRLLQRVVVGVLLSRLLPNAVGLVALAHHPEDFSEVRTDLGVGPSVIGAAQLLGGAFQVAL